MTIQATGWAWDQDLPPKVKLILLSLANHADHATGRVHFDAETIARDASVPVKSLWRYLGALERNGFLVRDPVKHDGKPAHEYWLVLDRVAAPWDWGSKGAGDDDEAGASDAGELSEIDEARASDSAEKDIPRPAPRRESTPPAAPASFARDRQARQRAEVKAAQPPPPEFVFVVKGSRAWGAWIEYRRATGLPPTLPEYSSVQDGRTRWGCHRPTLFPPQLPGAASPPADDVSALAEEGGRS